MSGEERREPVPAGYKMTEVGVIPEDWEIATVGERGTVIAGKALAVNGAGKQRPYLRTANVFDGFIDLSDVLHMPMTDAELERYVLEDGDVLLNEGQSLELVGRAAIYRDTLEQKLAIQNQLVRFRATSETDPEYAAFLFRRCQTSGGFARIALQTTSIAHLGVTRFQRLLLAWPGTRQEQRAIAEALSDVDNLLDALDRLIVKKRAVKQAVMQQLLTGKTRLPGFAGAWEIRKTARVTSTFAGGTPSTSVPQYYGGEIPWITSSDVNAGRIRSVTGRITQEGLINSSAKMVEPSTILVALYGATAGKIGFSEIRAAINQAVLAVVPIEDDPGHLFHLLTLTMPKVLSSLTQGGQPNLSGELVRSIDLYLPPLPEQRAIAEVLSDLDDEIAALEKRRDKTRRIKEGMMQQLLTGRVRLVAPSTIHAQGASS